MHGGGGTPERIGGLFHNTANYNDMVRRYLKKGSVVFAPQLLLWNVDIYQSKYDRVGVNRRLVQQSGSITSLETFEMMRCIDYFIAQGYGKGDRIGVVGLSYGGMYALYLSAVDTRIKSTVSHCWFNDRIKHNWHDWVYFGAESKFFDAEVASLILPRKLYIGIGDMDELFASEDGVKESKRLIHFAEEKGFLNRLSFRVFEGEHEMDKKDDDLSTFLADLKL